MVQCVQNGEKTGKPWLFSTFFRVVAIRHKSIHYLLHSNKRWSARQDGFVVVLTPSLSPQTDAARAPEPLIHCDAHWSRQYLASHSDCLVANVSGTTVISPVPSSTAPISAAAPTPRAVQGRHQRLGLRRGHSNEQPARGLRDRRSTWAISDAHTAVEPDLATRIFPVAHISFGQVARLA